MIRHSKAFETVRKVGVMNTTIHHFSVIHLTTSRKIPVNLNDFESLSFVFINISSIENNQTEVNYCYDVVTMIYQNLTCI